MPRYKFSLQERRTHAIFPHHCLSPSLPLFIFFSRLKKQHWTSHKANQAAKIKHISSQTHTLFFFFPLFFGNYFFSLSYSHPINHKKREKEKTLLFSHVIPFSSFAFSFCPVFGNKKNTQRNPRNASRARNNINTRESLSFSVLNKRCVNDNKEQEKKNPSLCST